MQSITFDYISRLNVKCVCIRFEFTLDKRVFFYPLQLVKIGLWQPSEQGVTIVKSRTENSACDCVHSFCQHRCTSVLQMQSTDVKVTRSTNIVYVFVEKNLQIACDTQTCWHSWKAGKRRINLCLLFASPTFSTREISLNLFQSCIFHPYLSLVC